MDLDDVCEQIGVRRETGVDQPAPAA